MLQNLKGKRVVLVFGSLDMGGAERQGLHVAEALQNIYGAEVQVWGLRSEPGRLSQLCGEKGIRWRGVQCGWGRFAITRVIKLTRFACLLRKERPDILISYTRLPNLVCGLTWVFSSARCLIWNQRDEGLLLTRDIWNRLAVRLTPLFISNSIAGKDFLVSTYRVDPSKIAVIHNGVESRAVASNSGLRDLMGLSTNTFVACMIANIHPYKDHHTLLKAWGELLKRVPPHEPVPVLLLAGRVDSGRRELEQLAGELGIDEQVVFLGSVDDVAGLLGTVDLCIHSSVSEGLPNAVLEAMAAGVPVVGTDIPGIREAVGPEGWPYLAPIGDAHALSSLIYKFFAAPQLRVRVGKLLQGRIEQKFSLCGMCEATAKFISNSGSN